MRLDIPANSSQMGEGSVGFNSRWVDFARSPKLAGRLQEFPRPEVPVTLAQQLSDRRTTTAQSFILAR